MALTPVACESGKKGPGPRDSDPRFPQVLDDYFALWIVGWGPREEAGVVSPSIIRNASFRLA